MNEYKSLTKEECADRLLAVSDPVIVMHENPDGDTVASAVALIRVCEALGKRATYACSDPIPERLKFILGDAKPAEDITGDCVTIDIASPSRVGALYEKLPAVKFSIDHHAVNTPFADNYTVADVSSASEALIDVIEVLESRGLLSLDKRIAEPLYTAISSDTGCFRFANATANTYAKAAKLLSFGIDSARINHLLFNSKSEEQLKAEGYISSKLQVSENGKISYATLSRAERESLGIPLTEFDTAIEVLRSLRGAEIAFVVKETDEGRMKTSLRSTCHNVAEVASIWGGGGHIRAAGCSPEAESVEDAKDIVLRELLKLF